VEFGVGSFVFIVIVLGCHFSLSRDVEASIAGKIRKIFIDDGVRAGLGAVARIWMGVGAG
jgi:hypothetical protein